MLHILGLIEGMIDLKGFRDTTRYKDMRPFSPLKTIFMAFVFPEQLAYHLGTMGVFYFHVAEPAFETTKQFFDAGW